MRTDELDYHLPPELIAHTPADRREAARLLVAHLTSNTTAHHQVADLPTLLQPGDLLVLNETRVLPARFFGTRVSTGGHVEGLFLETRNDQTWLVLLKSGGKLRQGEQIQLGPPELHHTLELLEKQPDGGWLVARHSPLDTQTLLEQLGSMPLPPYILRQRKEMGLTEEDLAPLDRERYQTVFARVPGAVAAPTAGLHLTEGLMAQLAAAGIELARLTLHVGMGTFKPVQEATLEAHDMHREWFSVPAETLHALRLARQQGRRILPVGTTSVRALESLPDPLPQLAPGEAFEADTQLLIQPGFQFRYTDGLMTNFHLPRSTLLALVAALTGLDRLQHLYQQAIEQRYRFYSYGDAMLLLPD